MGPLPGPLPEGLSRAQKGRDRRKTLQKRSFVFPATNGAPMRKSSLRRHSFEPLLKKAVLPHIRFHDLRHTAATLLLREDVHPKIVQERLGHARIAITLDTYSHVLPSMQQEAAARLDRMFATLDVRVRLQFGYTNPDQSQEDEGSDAVTVAELQEKEEWSHVDSNHGPPACEDDRGKMRRRPLKS